MPRSISERRPLRKRAGATCSAPARAAGLAAWRKSAGQRIWLYPWTRSGDEPPRLSARSAAAGSARATAASIGSRTKRGSAPLDATPGSAPGSRTSARRTACAARAARERSSSPSATWVRLLPELRHHHGPVRDVSSRRRARGRNARSAGQGLPQHQLRHARSTSYRRSSKRCGSRSSAASGLPIVYNTGGYDSPRVLGWLDGVVDIYMPDFKVWTRQSAMSLPQGRGLPGGRAPGRARRCTARSAPCCSTQRTGRRGVLVRHLVMPGCSPVGRDHAVPGRRCRPTPT